MEDIYKEAHQIFVIYAVTNAILVYLVILTAWRVQHLLLQEKVRQIVNVLQNITMILE